MARAARRRTRWREYVPQSIRQAEGALEAAAAERRGEIWSPVRAPAGTRKVAATVWGRAWCDNLERYQDFANRLPRGRTYFRNGSIVHLEIAAGRIEARVRGSALYRVSIAIAEVPAPRWKAIQSACASDIGSLVELLEGRLSASVMAVMTAKGEGLFPEPRELTMQCSCPDWATMCKHVAAVMYGVGARLDTAPALLFALRGVDPSALVGAIASRPIAAPTAGGDELSGDLGSIFGIDLVDHAPSRSVTTGVAKAGTRPEAAKRTKPASHRKTKTPAQAAESAMQEITRKQLIESGLSVATISGWYDRGVLESAGRPGVYRWTKRLAERIAARKR
jgi:uncharacterized Zn finger protein